jgi:6-phosphogluconolactonase
MAAFSLFIGSGDSDANIALRNYSMEPESGTLSLQQAYDTLSSLSYFTFSPDQRFLYAVSRVGGKGSVIAFRREDNNDLTQLNVQDSQGDGPCFVSTDQTGKWVFVANYSGGTVSVFPVKADGSIGPATQSIVFEGSSVNKDRQGEPHPHMIGPSPSNQYVVVPDLGTDKVMVYAFDVATGQLSPATQPFVAIEPGLGPRHFEYHPSKKFVYVIAELTNQLNVIAVNDEDAPTEVVQIVSLLPKGFTDYSKAADLHLTPNGKFLYASNRGHNSLAMFRVEENGQLTVLGHEPVRGDTPRNFVIDPSGNFLLVANRQSNLVVVFQIDQESGTLSFVAEYEVPNAMCIKFLK